MREHPEYTVEFLNVHVMDAGRLVQVPREAAHSAFPNEVALAEFGS
jgi:hypothetical protein